MPNAGAGQQTRLGAVFKNCVRKGRPLLYRLQNASNLIRSHQPLPQTNVGGVLSVCEPSTPETNPALHTNARSRTSKKDTNVFEPGLKNDTAILYLSTVLYCAAQSPEKKTLTVL